MSISLRDAEGVFLTVDPATTEWEPEPWPVETGDTASGDAGADCDRENLSCAGRARGEGYYDKRTQTAAGT